MRFLNRVHHKCTFSLTDPFHFRQLVYKKMMVAVEALDIAIINLTIPSIQAQFDVGNSTVQWLQTLYMLLYRRFLIIGGKLSDVIGTRKIFLSGALLFLLTSLGAGLAPSFQLLALFRALQGFAAALIMPSALSVISNTFTEKQERSKAIGIFSSFAAVGSGSGLSAGGLISSYFGWHWVFLMNVPVLLLLIAAAWIVLPEDTAGNKAEKIDLISGILLVVALLMLSYGLHQLSGLEDQYTAIISCLSGTALCGMLLYQRLTKHTAPLIDLSIFSTPTIITANIAFLILGSLFTGYLFFISLLLQKDMHFNAAESGMMLVPFSILSAVFSKLALPCLTRRISVEKLGLIGMAIMLTGGLAMLGAIFSGNPLPLTLVSACCIAGLGMTICFSSFSVLPIQQVPKQHYGLASSLANTSYFLGAGIGLSLLTLFMKSGTGVSVTPLPVIILCSYALAGLAVLTRHTYRYNC